MNTNLDNNNIINKCLAIEQWAYRCRHLIEVGDIEKIKFGLRRIRHTLEELEVWYKIDDE